VLSRPRASLSSLSALSARLRALRDRVRRAALALALGANRLTAAVFVGAGALMGVDMFGAFLALWPMFPTMVPIVLVLCAAAYGVVVLVRRLRR